MRTLRKTSGPVSIAYEMQGSGPLVVFLHGIGGNRTNWYEQLDHFGDRFCAVTPLAAVSPRLAADGRGA